MQLSLFTEEQVNHDPLRFKEGFLSIPIDLLVFALSNKKVNQVRLYIGLKTLYNGQFIPDEETITGISSLMGYKSKKTFNTNFNWLISNKWVYFKRGYCILKSFTKIKYHIEHPSTRSVIFKPKKDLVKFRPFAYGAVITHLMKIKGRRDRYTGTDQRRSPYKRYNPSSASLNIPATWLAAALGISKGSASAYKSIAARAGYLKLRKNYENLDVPAASFINYKKYAGDAQSHKLRVRKGILQRQLPDKITSKMTLKRKRNLRYIG